MAKLFVVSGPSGAGLRDILGAVLEQRQDIGSVIPVTARKMKAGEQNGVGFYFYDLDAWAALKQSGDLLETTEFAGNDYGTSRRLVAEQLEAGKNVLLNLEIDRAAQIKANMPEAVCIYMEPSDPAVLRARYESSARSLYEVPVRLEQAALQREKAQICDRFIPSDDPARAVQELNALLDAEG